jgi:HAE1 family hydrophobic/amphiphilic exporter-1
MVVDAAIVVLENIYRLREMGYSRTEAAFKGASEVWGAVFVSALTTVMVFIPILVMNLEVGQLFRDIAVALSVAVLLSLIVSITVIPALSKRLLKDPKRESRVNIRLPVIDDLARGFSNVTLALTRRVSKSRPLAMAVVTLIVLAGGFSTVHFLPKLDYLPDGNRNLLFGIIVPPPGYNLDTTARIAKGIENEIRPLWTDGSGDTDEIVKDDKSQPLKIQRFFFVASRGSTFLGAAAADPNRVKELQPILTKAAFKEPGTFGIVKQRSLFGRSVSGSRKIDFNISGPDLETTLGIALKAFGYISKVLPRSEGTQMRPRPGLELGAPEVRIIPNRVKLADNGVTVRELGETLDAFNDGIRVTEITVDGKRVDLTLKGPFNKSAETQGIGHLPVVTRSGTILSAGQLADVLVTSGPTEIRHIERERTVTLEIVPPERIPLEAAMDLLRNDVIARLQIRLAGTADQLTQTWDAMVVQLMMAVIIVYLVMAILFESFIYPAIVILSVPLATAGGIGGLALLNQFTFQTLDMLTLLGFIILIGIVVNNAILLVHQSLHHVRQEGMEVSAAIQEATRNRIRPIFMSTLTSIFGMLPLVMIPGAGSELYRGLGSVVVGGLTLSAVLTLAIIPPLLTLFMGAVESDKKKLPTSVEGSSAE